MFLKRALMIFLVTFSFTADVLCDLYIWVDENGVKHFSNTKPPEANENVNIDKEAPLDTNTEKSPGNKKYDSLLESYKKTNTPENKNKNNKPWKVTESASKCKVARQQLASAEKKPPKKRIIVGCAAKWDGYRHKRPPGCIAEIKKRNEEYQEDLDRHNKKIKELEDKIRCFCAGFIESDCPWLQ